MANLQFINETPSPPSTSIHPSSTALQLSGSLHGDTIQVEGDTGTLQFSVQFNIHNKRNRNHASNSHNRFIINDNIFDNLSPSSSYLTPPNANEVEVDQNAQTETDLLPTENNGNVEPGESESGKKVDVLTRLRSGALTPVKYYSRPISSMTCESSKGRKVKCAGKKGLLQTVLRRHSLPVRPCSSYAFFVMANWSSVENSSFHQVSKTLSQRWCQISPREKKVFANMALKDSARYKRQCRLLQGSRKRRARWGETSAVGYFSEQVEIIFSAFEDMIKELDAIAFKHHRRSIEHHLVKIWHDLLKSMMKEAEWQQKNATPPLDEYVENAYVSFALGPICHITAYFLGITLPQELMAGTEIYNLFKHVSLVGRLLNDLKSFKREREQGKYNSVSLRVLHSQGTLTEEAAIEETKRDIERYRKELLRMVVQKEGSSLPKSFRDFFWKSCNIMHYFYMDNDGYSSPKNEMANDAKAVLWEPITFPTIDYFF